MLEIERICCYCNYAQYLKGAPSVRPYCNKLDKMVKEDDSCEHFEVRSSITEGEDIR